MRRAQVLRRILTCRMLRERQIHCRRFSRPFARLTTPVHVLRPRGRQRRVQGGSRGRQWAWRVVELEWAVVCVLRRFRVGAYAE